MLNSFIILRILAMTSTYFFLSFVGEFENAPLGNVNVEDPDDWDRPDKEFSFVNQDTRNFFT